jgi:beta-glucosidase
VSVDVSNTGTRAGDEVAQLYMRENTSSVETPSRSLEGFSRIHLKPGETRSVVFRVPQQQLAVWNAEDKWAVEAGKYTVWVGGSSRAPLTTGFVLTP